MDRVLGLNSALFFFVFSSCYSHLLAQIQEIITQTPVIITCRKKVHFFVIVFCRKGGVKGVSFEREII